MSGPVGLPGHGPADPDGYLVEQADGGYRWTCRADGRTAGLFGTREDAVRSAASDRGAGAPDADPAPDVQDPRGR